MERDHRGAQRTSGEHALGPAHSRLPRSVTAGVVGVCILPAVFNLAGIDFGSSATAFDPGAFPGTTEDALVDLYHRALAGSFLHTILEWTAFAAAIFTVLLAFVQYAITRHVVTPLIAVTLLSAGAIDAFHTLAADRLIDSVADHTDLIPFTWAISRSFNAVVLLGGATFLLIFRKQAGTGQWPLIAAASLFLGVLGYAVVHVCAASDALPQTMFPGAVVSRPWDIGPLVLFALAGPLVLIRLHRTFPSVFAHALLISLIPQAATQAYMAFGSMTLFDNGFNVAHFLKIFAYAVPFVGLCLDYVYTYRDKAAALDELRATRADLNVETVHSQVLQREINARRLMERRLRQSEAEIRTILKTASDAILSTDADRNILLFNTQAEKLFGYSAEEVLGRPLEMLMPARYRRSHEELMARFGKEGDTQRAMGEFADLTGLHKNGTEIPIEVTIAKTDIDDQKVFTAIVRNVTERKRLEREIQTHLEQLKRSNAELEQFAYVASHDLQEPLRMVASYTTLLKKRYNDVLDDDGREFIDYAVDGAKRMQTLIQDLLMFSRVDRRGREFEAVALDDVLARTLDDLQIAVAENDVSITHDPLPVVSGDGQQLGLLLQNLLTNAMKFHGDEPPHIHVGASRNGSHWIVFVRDNGIGIDPQFTHRIFTIFQRLHRKEEYAGTGIGLAICKKIVERHGGRLWVESTPGAGSTFYFTLSPVETSGS